MKVSAKLTMALVALSLTGVACSSKSGSNKSVSESAPATETQKLTEAKKDEGNSSTEGQSKPQIIQNSLQHNVPTNPVYQKGTEQTQKTQMKIIRRKKTTNQSSSTSMRRTSTQVTSSQSTSRKKVVRRTTTRTIIRTVEGNQHRNADTPVVVVRENKKVTSKLEMITVNNDGDLVRIPKYIDILVATGPDYTGKKKLKRRVAKKVITLVDSLPPGVEYRVAIMPATHEFGLSGQPIAYNSYKGQNFLAIFSSSTDERITEDEIVRSLENGLDTTRKRNKKYRQHTSRMGYASIKEALTTHKESFQAYGMLRGYPLLAVYVGSKQDLCVSALNRSAIYRHLRHNKETTQKINELREDICKYDGVTSVSKARKELKKYHDGTMHLSFHHPITNLSNTFADLLGKIYPELYPEKR